MKDCPNCGHQNTLTSVACIECYAVLTDPEQDVQDSTVAKPKKTVLVPIEPPNPKHSTHKHQSNGRRRYWYGVPVVTLLLVAVVIFMKVIPYTSTIVAHQANILNTATSAASPVIPPEVYTYKGFLPTDSTALSDSDIWISGDCYHLQGTSNTTPCATGMSPFNLLHFNNGSWSTAVIGHTGLKINSILMVSDQNGWAGADDGIYHFNGSTWSKSLSTPDPIQQLQMLTTDDIWALGVGALYHLQGTQSHAFLYPLPSSGTVPVDIRTFHMLSPSDGWVVGGSILHFDGKKMVPVTFDEPQVNTTVTFDSINVLSDQDIWATGNVTSTTTNTSGYPRAIYHYDGAHWLPQTNSDGQGFELSMFGQDGWGIYNGGLYQQQDVQWTPVLVNGSGVFRQIAMSSDTSGWAISDNGVLHYTGISWQFIAADACAGKQICS